MRKGKKCECDVMKKSVICTYKMKVMPRMIKYKYKRNCIKSINCMKSRRIIAKASDDQQYPMLLS